MPITVFDAESILAERIGDLLTQIGKDPTATDGTPSIVYRDSLREGMASLGLTPASFAEITDDDLARVGDADVAQLLDVAELRLIDLAYGSITGGGYSIGSISESAASNSVNILNRLSARTLFVRNVYGYGLASLKPGSVRLRFSGSNDSSEAISPFRRRC